MSQRREQLRHSLLQVEQRLAAASARAGRDRGELTLVAVTKRHPAADVAHLAALGVCDIGESTDQEAAAKAAELAHLPLRWHLVGRLQRNKARSVARYAWAVHSLDRRALVAALSDGAVRAARELRVLVQVSLDGDPQRGGARIGDVPALADAVSVAEGLALRGVMAVAPLGTPPEPAFAVLAQVAERVRRDHAEATWISAGMSGDLEAAVAAGATHVRIGTALLGHRALPAR
jgi:pyridoxal phosphate enzyme (YggS family)